VYEIIVDVKGFQSIVAGWSGLIACDCETYGERWAANSRLLGVALSPEYTNNDIQGIYVPFNEFVEGKWLDTCSSTGNYIDARPLLKYIESNVLVGHNFTYDKTWIDKTFGIDSAWKVDTRIMWHLASAPAGPRPYSLKDAMVELLGWPHNNEDVLRMDVESKGGKLSNGDHYLASLEILAHYATLDTYATVQLYKHLKNFFDQHDYWWMLEKMMQYNLLLEKNTYEGIAVDKQGLQRSHNRLIKVKEAAKKRFLKELKNEITELEEAWADRRIAEYKKEYNKARYAAHPEEWRRFNLNSDKDKRELFYDKLKLPVSDTTPTGKPKVDADSLKRTNHPAMGAYLKYEHANTIVSNFSGPYIVSSNSDSKLHPGFNICGTVSYRLSGFKPYLLNAPFEEKAILRHLRVEEGFTGVHADLSAIEPTFTAHYSEDKSLLKVFQEGRGDIYLDLALELFPNNKELHNDYDPQIPITESVKQRFERQRKVAKVIQLAVAYTGTGYTVSKNLTKAGIPTTILEADRLVAAYWRKFRRVAEFNERLKSLNREQGYLRNVIGRIIRVPNPDYKDLPNRFIQSSAHDVLILWVLEIYRLCKERGIDIKPVLLDCHDSTSNQCPSHQIDSLKQVYKESLTNINKLLDLSVTIKAEIKTFKTLAGLKNNED
jgi:DNA polymerase I-like protein with 3'-5' exonuclease and polymerase domains